MSWGRQIAAFALVGLGVGLGFAAVDAVFGSRRVVVKDVYSNGSSAGQQPPQRARAAAQSTLHPSAASPGECADAMAALSDCERRNGVGSAVCRLFRGRVEECHRTQSAFADGAARLRSGA